MSASRIGSAGAASVELISVGTRLAVIMVLDSTHNTVHE
ncbi:hypothetical protein BN903_30 [Halorubrum sp. AJ67]|nr:hypothetical protein BN903_30 [Halorubrum sp. AJ67]